MALETVPETVTKGDQTTGEPGSGLKATGQVFDYIYGARTEAGDPLGAAFDGEVPAGAPGSHTIYRFEPPAPKPGEGGREAFDEANWPGRLHPTLATLEGRTIDIEKQEIEGKADHPIFPSSWWPQSKNGIAHRWSWSLANAGRHIPDDGSTAPYDDILDGLDLQLFAFGNTKWRDNVSPVEKYDLLFNRSVADGSNKYVVPEVTNLSFEEFRDNTKRNASERQTDKTKKVWKRVGVAGPATRWSLMNHGNWQQHYRPQAWWGYCNGWASYATSEQLGAPDRDIRVKRVESCDESATCFEVGTKHAIAKCADDDQSCMLVRMADIEALMSSLHFSDSATFVASRCEETVDDLQVDDFGRPKDPKCRDVNAGTFHLALVKLMGEGATPLREYYKNGDSGEKAKLAFVIDHNMDYEVWNFPVESFEITKFTLLEDDEDGKAVDKANQLVCGTEAVSAEKCERNKYAFNTEAERLAVVSADYVMISDDVPSAQLLNSAKARYDDVEKHHVKLSYVLELKAGEGSGYEVLGGEWINIEFDSPVRLPGHSNGVTSKKLHPDFVWMAIDADGYRGRNGENYDDTKDGDNPFIRYSFVRNLLAWSKDNAPQVDAPVEPADSRKPGGPLLISEYIEGKNTHALEIVNASGTERTLNQCFLTVYENGKERRRKTMSLTGKLAAGQTTVLCDRKTERAAARGVCDGPTLPTTWTGNDAIVLSCGQNPKDALVSDVIGVIGENPGRAGWRGVNANGDAMRTTDMTLRRACGTTVGSAAVDGPMDFSTWTPAPMDDLTDLGTYNQVCEQES